VWAEAADPQAFFQVIFPAVGAARPAVFVYPAAGLPDILGFFCHCFFNHCYVPLFD
jgi:hypothetical protein